MTHPFNRSLCLFFLLLLFYSCQRSALSNLCDPKTEDYLESLLLRYINFDETDHCGLVLKVNPPTYLICPPLVPKINGVFFSESFETDGNRISFSSNPPLPEGISFSPFFSSLQGSYFGWKANRTNFTITASNPKGSASCTYKPAWMGKLPLKTNLTSCYDGANNPDPTCTALPGQDGHLQKGLSQNYVGPSLVAGVEITTDLNTGLIWTSCQRGKTGIGCPTIGTTTFSFSGAQTECTSLNAGAGFANRTDWRVPEMEEYSSTFNYAVANPSINTTYFPATDSFNFKTNTSNAAATAAFYPTFIESSIGAGNYSDMHHLRCVSNGSPPTAKRLLDNGNGTITDLDTSLVWQRCTAGQTNITTCTGGTDLITNWASAVSYCQGLNLAGKIWRLPNVSELRGLLDYYLTFGSPGFDPIYFPNTASSNYWTSTTSTLSAASAYIVDFGSSSGGSDVKSNNATNRTRCVTDF